MRNIRRYLITNKAYGDTGRRDDHLEMSGVHVGGRQGTLHFIRFPTSQVSIMKIWKPNRNMLYLRNHNSRWIHTYVKKLNP